MDYLLSKLVETSPGWAIFLVFIWIVFKNKLISFGKNGNGKSSTVFVTNDQFQGLSKRLEKLEQTIGENNRIINDALGKDGYLAKEDGEDGRKWVYFTPKMKDVQVEQVKLSDKIITLLEHIISRLPNAKT